MQKKPKPIEEKKETAKEEVEEWKNKHLRALADYHNLEKRTEQQTIQQRKEAVRKLLLKFLNVLDNLERAEVFIKDTGLKLVKDEFLRILKEEGVEEMDLLKKPYDPYLAECIEVVAGNEDDIVSKIVKKGYKLNNEVLRTAQVKVTKKIPAV